MIITDDELLAAIAQHGSQRKAAAALGIPRSTLGDWVRAVKSGRLPAAAIMNKLGPMPEKVNHGARILVIDIETAPIKAAVWRIWQENVGLEQIASDWHLLSYCAKWLGEDAVFYDDQSHAQDIEDDRPLLDQLHALLDEADVVIAHNADKFDVPKIRWRLLKHGFKPPKPFKTIDTLKVLKRSFGATSNKMAFISGELLDNRKDEHHDFQGFKLWAGCLDGDKRAWAEMKKYNIQDVIALEELYLRLRPWIPHHLNVGVYGDHDERTCSRCGSHNLQLVGTHATNVNVYALYECKDCGGHSRGRQTMVTTASRRTLLVAT